MCTEFWFLQRKCSRGELFNERGREMFAEHSRRQDLIRFDLWGQVIKWILPTSQYYEVVNAQKTDTYLYSCIQFLKYRWPLTPIWFQNPALLAQYIGINHLYESQAIIIFALLSFSIIQPLPTRLMDSSPTPSPREKRLKKKTICINPSPLERDLGWVNPGLGEDLGRR